MNKKLKPILAGTAIIIPIIALLCLDEEAQAFKGPKGTLGKLGLGLRRGSTGLLSELGKRVNVNVNVNKINILNSNINTSGNNTTPKPSNKPSTTPGNLGPVYENFLSLNPNKKPTPPQNPNKNRPLPDIPKGSSNKTTGNNLGLKKKPPYNPNKGPAPQPPSSNKNPGNQSLKKRPPYNPNKGPAPKPPKQEPIYEEIHLTKPQDKVIVTTTGGNNSGKLQNRPSKYDPIYDEVAGDPIYQNTNPPKKPPKLETIYDKVADDPIYQNTNSIKNPSKNDPIYDEVAN